MKRDAWILSNSCWLFPLCTEKPPRSMGGVVFCVNFVVVLLGVFIIRLHLFIVHAISDAVVPQEDLKTSPRPLLVSILQGTMRAQGSQTTATSGPAMSPMAMHPPSQTFFLSCFLSCSISSAPWT